MSDVKSSTLSCGATLVTEAIANVRSVAINWLLPVGSATDPANADGTAAMLAEMIFRGAGGLSSREHSDALDRIGMQRSSGVAVHHLRLSAVAIGERLLEGLPLLVKMIRQPALAADALEPVRSLCLQTIDGLEDDRQHLVMLRLDGRHRPPPFNRHGHGERAAIESLTLDDLRAAWARRCVPDGTIIAIAGEIPDRARLVDTLEQLLGEWRGTHRSPEPSAEAERGLLHVAEDTAQVHIGVAWDAPPERDENSMVERLGIGVLSGGTSARLFTEVRQKRSLCYSVGASYRAGRDHGMVALYAGTTPERAQETLDVCLEEVQRLGDGATDEEFDRAVIGLRSSIIMHGESTSSRAASLARDQFRLGRPRTLEEVSAAIDAVTLEDLNAYLAARAAGPFTVACIGPSELAVPVSQLS